MPSVLFQRAMENQPATNSSQSLLVRLRPWLAVLAVLIFIGFIRVRLLEMPLERDEGEYAYAGQLILQGIPPYELAYNMKLPGTYYAYAAGMAVFGETAKGIHLTLLAANGLTIIFVFLLGRRLFGVTAGLPACASYAIMSVSPFVLGMAAHATQFVVLFAVPATLLLWQAVEDNRLRTFFFSGLLYGLAFLMKQQGICFCLFAAAFLIWRASRNKSILTNSFAKTVMALGSGMILPFAFFCLVETIAGNFSRFWFWTFTVASSYAGFVPLTEGIRLLAGHLQGTAVAALGFWALLATGLPVAWQNGKQRDKMIFAVLLWMFSFCGVAMGLYFRAHYFVLALPAFAIAIGLAVQSLQTALQSKTAKILVAVFFIAAAVWNVSASRIFFFQLSPLQASNAIYHGNPFIEAVDASRYIREHSAEDARIAVIGSEPEIYFYAHRQSATGYIYTYSLMEPQPAALRMQREMAAEIESSKPEYLVMAGYQYSWIVRPASELSIFNWFDKYSGEFYEKVGVVSTRSDGEAVRLWDDKAKNYNGPLQESLIIYRRKQNPESPPSK